MENSEDHVLEVDHSADDTDDSERMSSGHSVFDDSSITEYGRTYHSYKQGSYFLPNDGEEQQRLDLQHHTINILLNDRLALAPITNPKAALDIATGTGVWAVQFAKRNPDCYVTGTDLTLIQPASTAPSNCEFIKEDAENDEWTCRQGFDYVHFRLVFTCFNDLPLVLRKTYEHLNPGGWVEFQDHTPEVLSPDGSSSGSGMEKFGQAVTRGLSSIGRDANRIKALPDMLAAQGFSAIQKKLFAYPIGSWPLYPKYKEVGKWMAQNVALGLEGSVKMLLMSGLTSSEVADLIQQVKAELKGGSVHGYMLFYVVYAQKPHVSGK